MHTPSLSRGKVTPVLILHGGAGRSMPARQKKRIQKKLRRILDAAYDRLLSTNALDAAVYAVTLLENDRIFNAGTGAVLQRDGRSRLSSSVMDGSSLTFSGVVNIENFKNPVLIARALQKESSKVLSEKGAAEFARKAGFKACDTRTPAAVKRWKRKRKEGGDTVGACALDQHGNLAAATSTGGRGMELPGRVSDSCMPSGNFATADCAVSATGHGEQIMSEGLAVRIAQRVGDGLPLSRAFRKTFREVEAHGFLMGAVALDKKGRAAAAKTTETLAYAWRKKSARGIFV